MRVAVARAGGREEVLRVPLLARSMHVEGVWVTVEAYGVKPYLERVVDLAQGLEWDGVVHVEASRIFGWRSRGQSLWRTWVSRSAMAPALSQREPEARVAVRGRHKTDWYRVFKRDDGIDV